MLVGVEAVDLGAVGDQPGAAAGARGPLAADGERRRAGEGEAEAVVTDIGGVAALQPLHVARVAEAGEALVAGEVEGDRGAAADRVGDVDAAVVGLGEEGADVEVAAAAVRPLGRREDLAAPGREGAEGGLAGGVCGDEEEVPEPEVAAVFGAGIDAVAGGQYQLAAGAVDRGPRAVAAFVADLDEDATVEGVRRDFRGAYGEEAGTGEDGGPAEAQARLPLAVEDELERSRAFHPLGRPVAEGAGGFGPVGGGAGDRRCGSVRTHGAAGPVGDQEDRGGNDEADEHQLEVDGADAGMRIHRVAEDKETRPLGQMVGRSGKWPPRPGRACVSRREG